MTNYHFKIFKEDNGYWCECLELDGCCAEGNTFEELEKNMNEAIDLYLAIDE